MKTTKTRCAKPAGEKSPARRPAEKFVLRLFVAGATARSREAVLRVRRLCEAQLDCTLEVIDIYQQPQLARVHQIVATPTLVMELPRPSRRFIGSLVNIAALFPNSEFTVRTEIVL